MQVNYPKITIVTPVYNQVDFLEATIQSVIEQNYPNLEYIVVDGGSTDGTIEIIKKYEANITYWVTELDDGMYDALNKGFNVSSGEIMGWINSDDILLPNSLFQMAGLFTDLPDVKWIQGLNTIINLKGYIVYTKIPKRFSLYTFLIGEYKWIQQESTFWRRTLWQAAGGRIKSSLKLAGDFELWFRFFQYDKLYYVNIPIGAWRMRPGQMSVLHKDAYNSEAEKTVDLYSKNKKQLKALQKIAHIDLLMNALKISKVIKLSHMINLRNKYLNIQDIEIVYSHKRQKFQLEKYKIKF